MTAEAVGFYGCDRSGFLDLWNCERTFAYVKAHSPHAWRINGSLCCPDYSAYMPTPTESDPYTFGPYTNPVDDDAWWWDVFRPESAAFLGMQVTKLSGLTGNTIEQETFSTARCDRAIGYEPVVSKGYTLTFEAVLHGLTCCATAFGLRALRKALEGCCSDNQCMGTKLRLLTCLPEIADVCATWLPPVDDTVPWRTLVNVKMIEQPSVIEGSGQSCGQCGCKPLTRIMFTLQANGEQFLDPRVILAETPLTFNGGGLADCVLVPCAPVAPCPDPVDFLIDPNCPPAILVPPADVAAVTCFCPPLFRAETCFTIDLGTRTFDSDIEVIIKAGSAPLRNLEVLIWTQLGTLPYSSGYYDECNTCNGFTVSYIPRGATLYRDMCGVSVVSGTSVRRNATQVFAGIGGRYHEPCLRLPCGRFIICIRTDGSGTAPDATIQINAREVEP